MTKKDTLTPPSQTKKKSGHSLLIFITITIILALLAVVFILFETEKPLIKTEKTLQSIGAKTTIPIYAADDKSGIRSIKVIIRQGKLEKELYSKLFMRKGWLTGAGPKKIRENFVLDTQKTGIKDGEAELVFSARDFSLYSLLKGNETFNSYKITVDTKPPKITNRYSQRYILPGGSGIVIYSLSEPAPRHGVVVNDRFFAGFPFSDHENEYLAYITLPWNSKKIISSYITAQDKAGNNGKNIFSIILKKSSDRHDNINISDEFLKRKIPEFEEHYPEMKGNLVEKFIYINNTVREKNSQAIRDICRNPIKEQLWYGRFLRMPGESRAGFGDQRTYYYNGKPIDEQVHLGIDIASTSNIGINAANKGKVIYTGFIGIYGNIVIIDHGQGVFSLYAHLSSIDTEVGSLVEKGETIGHSGATGMAGGDHLHFSMLINGEFVIPLEWWDQRWIDINITDVIKDNLL